MFKISTDKIFRRTKFSAASQIFGSLSAEILSDKGEIENLLVKSVWEPNPHPFSQKYTSKIRLVILIRITFIKMTSLFIHGT